MIPSLSVVADTDPKPAKPETLAGRVQRLQAAAKAGAREHVAEFGAMLEDLRAMAGDIANGGDAYSAGSRDLARNIAMDCERQAQTLEAITGRGRP